MDKTLNLITRLLKRSNTSYYYEQFFGCPPFSVNFISDGLSVRIYEETSDVKILRDEGKWE